MVLLALYPRTLWGVHPVVLDSMGRYTALIPEERTVVAEALFRDVIMRGVGRATVVQAVARETAQQAEERVITVEVPEQ